jgi:hypothetical protein
MLRLFAATMAGAIALAPALAADLEGQAKLVLDGYALLKKSEQSCAAAALRKSDQLALTYARAAAEQALTISQFQAIDQAAVASAAAQAESRGFCQETKRKKSGLMSRIKKGGKALVKARRPA